MPPAWHYPHLKKFSYPGIERRDRDVPSRAKSPSRYPAPGNHRSEPVEKDRWSGSLPSKIIAAPLRGAGTGPVGGHGTGGEVSFGFVIVEDILIALRVIQLAHVGAANIYENRRK